MPTKICKGRKNDEVTGIGKVADDDLTFFPEKHIFGVGKGKII